METDITDGHDISYATLVTVFVARVFERKSTADLFYTNDLKVIVDTALREIQDRGDHHMLRLAHLSALYYLLVNARYTSTNHKPALIVVVMDRIIGDPLTDDDTRALAAKILHDCSNTLQLA